jgi:hypothetical protein
MQAVCSITGFHIIQTKELSMSKSKNGRVQGHEIISRWWIGDVVYRKVDSAGLPGLITGIIINPENSIIYRVSFDDENNTFYELELDVAPHFVLAPEEDDDKQPA